MKNDTCEKLVSYAICHTYGQRSEPIPKDAKCNVRWTELAKRLLFIYNKLHNMIFEGILSQPKILLAHFRIRLFSLLHSQKFHHIEIPFSEVLQFNYLLSYQAFSK